MLKKHKQLQYDVVIVGAGVSGMRLADLLEKTSLQVLLLEKKRKIEISPRTFGTFTKIVREHGLEKFIDAYFDTWTFYGPNVKASRSAKKIMCLINYAKWQRSLNFKNVVIKTGVNLKKARRVSDGIQLIDDKKNKYLGRVVVDSSGYAQIVRKLLKLPVSVETGLSYEMEFDGCKLSKKREAAFILDFQISNSGGWIYLLPQRSAKSGKVQFGWADFCPENKATLANLRKRTIRGSKFPQFAKILKGGHVTYCYGRFGPTGNNTPQVDDQLISIGDAGNCGTPATLEGFRQSVDTALMAYKTILKAHKKNNYCKDRLMMFEELFYKKYGKYYRLHKALRYVYLRYARNEELDRWLANFNKVNKRDFFRLIRGEFTVRLLMSTLDTVLVGNMILNFLNSLLPKPLNFRKKITKSKKEIIYEKN